MDLSTLKDFAELKSKILVQDFYDKALSILLSALDDLLKENKNISLNHENTRIFPIGDYTNDTFIDQTGELEIVIATTSSQVKISNETYLKSLKEAKTKKQKKSISDKGTFDEIIMNYLNKLVNYFDETTMLILVNNGIKILCFEEYGFKILIRFATYDSEDKQAILNFWDPINKHMQKTNLFLYNEMIAKKDEETHGNYKKLVRIFKNIRKTILLNKWASSNDINKYFVELVVYNIPNSLMMDKEEDKLFYKAINYLDNCNILEFKSFDGDKIEHFDFAKITYNKIKNFIMLVSKVSF